MSVNGTEEIPDPHLAFFVLGFLRWAVAQESFPIYLDTIEENFGDDGMVESFTLVTRSGLRYRVNVTFEGETP